MDFLDKGTTITGIYYADLVTEVRKQRRKTRNTPLWLLQDNAPVHNSEVILQAIRESGFQLLHHPPYSPDVAPSDFYLFKHLKKSMRGKHFESADELKQFVEAWFSGCPKDFFSRAFDELLIRWNKLVSVNGSYIEK